MKRILGSLILLLVVFIVFALVVAQFRASPVSVRLPFFATTQVSVEGIAYISFFTGFVLAVIVFLLDNLALRRQFRRRLAQQKPGRETVVTSGKENGGEEQPPA